MKVFKVLGLLVFLFGCGSHVEERTERTQLTPEQQKIIALQEQINSVIQSDFATCNAAGTETSDLIIRNICNIAKASTEEARVELKQRLVIVSNQLQNQLNSGKTDILDVQAQMNNINSLLAQLQVSIATGMSSVDLASDTTLVGYGPVFETVLRQQDRSKINSFVESYTNLSLTANPLSRIGATSITATVAGSLINATAHGLQNGAAVMFSTSNTLPAPLATSTVYYVISATANTFQVSLTSGGAAVVLTTTGTGSHNISSTQVTVTTSAAHGLTAGDSVTLAGLAGAGGILSMSLVGDFRVEAAPSTTTFTITVDTFPTTSSASFGGTVVSSAKKLLGRAMSTSWQTANGEQLKVAKGTKTYNVLILDATSVVAVAPGSSPAWFVVNSANAANSGTICWKKDNASATAANIKAGGATVTCR